MRINVTHFKPCEDVFHLQSLSHARISRNPTALENLVGTDIFHGLMKGQLIDRTVFDFSDLFF